MERQELESYEEWTSSSRSSFICNLMSKLNNLLKKPKVDGQLGQLLEELTEKLINCDKYLDNGIFNINFTEIALLLQGAAQLYGKKVDLLWDCVFDYQKEINELEREAAKRRQVEEAAKEHQLRYKRKRKCEEAKDQASINELLQLSSHIQNTKMAVCETLQADWVYAQIKERNYLEDVPYEVCSRLRGTSCLISSKVSTDSDDLIYFDKLRMSDAAFELSQEYPVLMGRCLKKNPSNIPHFYEQDEVLQKFLVEQKTNVIEVEKLHRDSYKSYFTEHLSKKMNIDTPDIYSKLCPKRLVAHVKRLSEDVVHQYLMKDPTLLSNEIKRANSTVPSSQESSAREMDSGYFDCSSEMEQNSSTDDISSCAPADDVNVTSETFTETDHNVSTDIQPSYLELENSFTEVSISTDNIPSNTTQNDAASEIDDTPKRLDEETEVIENVKCQKRKRRRKLDFGSELTSDIEGLGKCKLKSTDEQLTKRKRAEVLPVITRTAFLHVFEEFYLKNYIAERNEGDCTDMTNIEVENASLCDSHNDADAEEFIYSGKTKAAEKESIDDDVVSSEETHYGTQEQSEPELDTNLVEPAAIITKNVMKRIEKERKEREKLEEWKSFITNKVGKQVQHNDFNIHHYGTQILEKISEGHKTSFKEIVHEKNASEVSKYFLTILQLASTHNIEITNSSKGQLGNDSLEVRLLSRECYHENLESYMAPSEESFNARLAKAELVSSVSKGKKDKCFLRRS